jgi:hypothetical protein
MDAPMYGLRMLIDVLLDGCRLEGISRGLLRQEVDELAQAVGAVRHLGLGKVGIAYSQN